MCGITGIIQRGDQELQSRIEKMAAALAHRGPDDSAVWVDQSKGVALGFRRLSIQDLTVLGRQPIVSHGGRYVMVFNGEIYNFQELRVELERKGVEFRGASDTEVAMACIERWGLETAVMKFIGMFAIAVWDKERRELTLVRDRLGVKPLYWGRF